jgi:nucleotide-binding universal stress UspA family protein
MSGTATNDRAQGATRDEGVQFGPVLLAFDGSRDAEMAIATAGRLLGPRDALVVTAWEPAASWVPYDPVTVLAAPVERLISRLAGIDDELTDLAQRTMQRGVELAIEAGFHAEARLVRGKPARVISEVADEIAADPIVVGARGAGRIESALLGNVSESLVVHAKRPVLVVPHHSER